MGTHKEVRGGGWGSEITVDNFADPPLQPGKWWLLPENTIPLFFHCWKRRRSDWISTTMIFLHDQWSLPSNRCICHNMYFVYFCRNIWVKKNRFYYWEVSSLHILLVVCRMIFSNFATEKIVLFVFHSCEKCNWHFFWFLNVHCKMKSYWEKYCIERQVEVDI
jgi:hypothetical protein